MNHNDCYEYPFPILPFELNILLFEDYLNDRLNLLRCLNKSFQFFIDDFLTKVKNKTTDDLIYLESQSLLNYAKDNSIVVNQDTKIKALNKGKKLSHSILYPMTQNIIIRLIQLDFVEHNNFLSKILTDWPFVCKVNDVYLSFLLESTATVFEKFMNSFGHSITPKQLSLIIQSKSKRKFNFRFQNVHKFEQLFPSIDLTHVQFDFASDFKFSDFVDFNISTKYLNQIDFAVFVHDEPIMIDIIKRRSLCDLYQYRKTLIQYSNDFEKPFEKVCSRICLNMGWLEPFLGTSLSLLSLHSGCKIPSNYQNDYLQLIHKINTLDILLFSDDDFYDFALKMRRKSLTLSFLRMFSSMLVQFPQPKFERLLADVVNDIEQTPFFVKFKAMYSLDFTKHRIRKFHLIYNFHPTTLTTRNFWFGFFKYLDQVYQPENKEQELSIFNEFVQSFKKSTEPLILLTLGDIDPLKHTDLLPIYQQVLTFEQDDSPLDILLIVKQIDENVVNFLINTMPSSKRQLKPYHIQKIKSPKVFISAWKNYFLQPGDQMPLFLINCFSLFLKWDRVELFSNMWTNGCISSWLETFYYTIPPILSRDFAFTFDQINQLDRYINKMLKS